MTDQPMVAAVDLSKYIETRVFGERPHVRNRRVPVATLAHSARIQGWSVAELAYNFGLSEVQGLAALLYYEEHKDIIQGKRIKNLSGSLKFRRVL